MKERRNAPHEQLTVKSKIYGVPYTLLRRPGFLQKEFNTARADRMAANFNLEGLGRLVVNHRDGFFDIIDGCHRHYALGKNEFTKYDIPCEVYEGLTDDEMARIFLLLSARRVMSAYERFNVNVEANTARECDILRVVNGLGLKISRAKSNGCISAVSALVKVYDLGGGALGGAKLIGHVLRTLNGAYDGDPAAFDGQLILGAAFVSNRFNGRVQEKALIEKLAALPNGVRGILQKAEALKAKTGHEKSQCISAVLVELHNRGLAHKDRLPSWWKSVEEVAA
jgi:hypothetical protein